MSNAAVIAPTNMETRKKVYLWGAGYYADFIYSVIDQRTCSIEGVIDSDLCKQGKEWKYGLHIFPPKRLESIKFDYLFITPRNYDEIRHQCLDMKIPEEKVIIYWRDDEAVGFYENRADRVILSEERCVRYKNRLLNAPYEWGLKKSPIIKSSLELLNRIITDRCSLCRFGDGEFEIMCQRERPWFQNTDTKLAQRLREIIVSKREDIVIALADNFGNLEKYKEEAADDIRGYMLQSREDIYKLIDRKCVYYNAYVSRPYIIYRDKKHADHIFKLFKRVWQKRNILLLEGISAKIGVGNDLFDGAISVSRIECPERNAWDKYDEIWHCVKRIARKDDLICISLGPTATVLAYDLAVSGYQALDIGQLDNEYEWYLGNAETRVPIAGKMVAEIGIECRETDSKIEGQREYKEQIIAKME